MCPQKLGLNDFYSYLNMYFRIIYLIIKIKIRNICVLYILYKMFLLSLKSHVYPAQDDISARTVSI